MRLRPDVRPLVDAGVRTDVEVVAGTVRGSTRSVPHSHDAVEVDDAVWLSIKAIEGRRRAGKKLRDEGRNDIAALNRYRVDLAACKQPLARRDVAKANFGRRRILPPIPGFP